MQQKDLNLKLLKSKRKSINVTQEGLIKTGYLREGATLPLVVEPAMENLDLVSCVKKNRDFLEEALIRDGGILFRGFNVRSAAAFEQVVHCFVPQPSNYIEGSSPRVKVSDKMYTSTEYPPAYFISMHNELSYAHTWPTKIFFCCIQRPQEGGETPIADSRKVLEALAPEIREKFLQKGVKYIRNLHDDRGAGLSWQTVFETDDKAFVEHYCQEGKIAYRWKDGGGLWTSQVRPAIIKHPQTGQMVWFNQADQWHPSNLGKEEALLLASTPEEELPINAYYGDGSPFEPQELEAVRTAFKETMVIFPWQEGDILMLDNMLTAHGRMPFVGTRKVVVAMGKPVTYANGEVHL